MRKQYEHCSGRNEGHQILNPSSAILNLRGSKHRCHLSEMATWDPWLIHSISHVTAAENWRAKHPLNYSTSLFIFPIVSSSNFLDHHSKVEKQRYVNKLQVWAPVLQSIYSTRSSILLHIIKQFK